MISQVVEGEPQRKSRSPLREQGLARITLDLPEAQHRRLKIAAIEGGTTMRQIIIDLLEREGIRNQ
jgi:hypothetical protein